MPKRNLVVLAIVCLLALDAAVFWSVRHQVAVGRPDYSAFYTAGKIVLDRNGSQLYDYGVQARTQEREFPHKADHPVAPLLYIHPPFEALIEAPLALLPYVPAFLTWYAISFVLLISVPLLLIRGGPLENLRAYLPWMILLVGGFLPAVQGLLQGQDATIVLLAFTICYLCLRGGRHSLAGWALALATIKPHLVLPLVLILIVSREWKVIAGFAQACGALLLVSVGVVGWRGLVSYPRFLVAFDRLPVESAAAYPDKMANVRGVLYVAFAGRVSDNGIKLAALAIAVGLVVCLLRAWRTPERQAQTFDLKFSLAIPISLLIGYHLNTHDLTLLLLPVLLIANYWKSGEGSSRWRMPLAISTGLVVLAPFTMNAQLTFVAIVLFAATIAAEIKALSRLQPERTTSASAAAS